MTEYLRKIDMNMGKPEYDMYQEIPHDETGSENFANGLSFSEFKDFLQQLLDMETIEISEEDTPRIVYIMYKDDYPIGEIAIRKDLNEFWREHSGNVGYKIRPTERKKGYGTKMLKLALEECKKLGMKEAFLQCNDKNIGSMKVITNNNGVLISKDDGTNYYKIDLSNGVGE